HIAADDLRPRILLRTLRLVGVVDVALPVELLELRADFGQAVAPVAKQEADDLRVLLAGFLHDSNEMSEAQAVGLPVAHARRLRPEQLEEKRCLPRPRFGGGGAGRAGRAAAEPRPPPAGEQLVEHVQVAYGKRPVHVRDRRTGAGGLVEGEPGLATTSALAPERLHPPPLVRRDHPAERAAAARERLDEVVGEEVGHVSERAAAEPAADACRGRRRRYERP